MHIPYGKELNATLKMVHTVKVNMYTYYTDIRPLRPRCRTVSNDQLRFLVRIFQSKAAGIQTDQCLCDPPASIKQTPPSVTLPIRAQPNSSGGSISLGRVNSKT